MIIILSIMARLSLIVILHPIDINFPVRFSGATLATFGGAGCQISHEQDYFSAILDTDAGASPLYVRTPED